MKAVVNKQRVMVNKQHYYANDTVQLWTGTNF